MQNFLTNDFIDEQFQKRNNFNLDKVKNTEDDQHYIKIQYIRKISGKFSMKSKQSLKTSE